MSLSFSSMNLYLLFFVVLIYFLHSLNCTPLIPDELDPKMSKIGCTHREKRQLANRFVQNNTDFQQFSRVSTERRVCSFKSIDVECLSDAHYRTFDGICNNLVNPWWGRTNVPFRRLMKNNYADGVFLPISLSVTGIPLASPRVISNVCSNEIGNSTEPVVNAFFTSFAQFLDHDLSSTANGNDNDGHPIICQCREEIMNPFCLNIPTPDMPDQLCMIFPRSSDFFQRDLACQLTAREQVNQINSYLDASMVYGSSKSKADQLRTFNNGQLKTTGLGLPPQTHAGGKEDKCLGAQINRGCFLCGDTRANENMGLTSFHMLFIRLHNRLALSLSNINRFWPDEIIYHETRRIVNGILQHITYNEFLPLLIGSFRSNFGFYQYNPSIDATISNEFATAAFRFGHTLVNGFVRRFNDRHEMTKEIPLANIIFSPVEAYNQQMGGLDTLLLGLLFTPSAKFDSMFSDVLRNHLFEATKRGTPVETKRLDLSAININRGRDHGLTSYNSMRQFCGLRRALSFNDLLDTMDSSVIDKLSSVYAHVDDIDLYMGGISERSVADGVVGPTFACIIARQFADLRRGDRFFYTTQMPSLRFTAEQLNEIQDVTLSSILCQTLDDVIELPRNALKVVNSVNNQFVSCSSFPPFNLLLWRE